MNVKGTSIIIIRTHCYAWGKELKRLTAILALIEPKQHAYDSTHNENESRKVKLRHMLPESLRVFDGIKVKREEQK